MPRMVCMKCGLFFHPKKNGVAVEEGMPGGGSVQGSEPDGWGPYKLWMADLLECRGCGTEVVAGFAPSPIAEHFWSNYKSVKEREPPIVFVKDCM